MKFLPAVITALGAACLTLSASHSVQAQFGTPPVIDGVISNGEYGSSYVTGDQTWYMSWDENNLYVATTVAGITEATVMYFDTDPDRSMLVNNVNNAGTIEGFNYDNSGGTLPFSADAVMYIKPSNNYREVRRYSAEISRWGDQKPSIGTIANNGNDVREFSIPWAEISTTNSRPTNFNWLGYVTNGSGFVYAQVPFDSPRGFIGTNASFLRYFTVLNTNEGSATRAFGPNNLDSYSHSGPNEDTFGPITVYDFTLNTPSAFITRAGAGSAWSIQGNLRVGNGSLDFGTSTASVSVAGDLTFANPAAFTAGNASVILTSNINQTINGDTYSRLTIDGNGIKTLAGNNLSVTNSLVLNKGTLVTGPYSVDLGTTGDLLEDNGYLQGTVEATRSINGPGSNSFGNIGLTLTSPSGAQSFPGSVLVQRITGGFGIDTPTNVPTANKTIRRRFFINASNDNIINTILAFTYRSGNPDELEGNSASQSLSLYQSTDRVLGYAPVDVDLDVHDNQNRTVVYTGPLNLNGYFSLADGRNPLPVELVSFTGKAENSSVRLNWATASELQNKGFDIEHRTDLGEWKKLSFVAGHGTTSQRNNYTYVDRSASAGNNYYRLRQIDVDGKAVYSQPVTVQMGAVAFTLSPVPATDALTLNGLGAGKHITEIYNVRGQRVMSQTFSDEAATTLPVSTLPAGVYMVRVLGPDRNVRQARFIKQ